MHIELVTEPGVPDHPNEDWAAAVAPAAGSGGALVLLDGVTPPIGEYGCRHGVPWFTARLGGTLTELCASRRDLTLTEILARSIQHTANAHDTSCDLSHPRTPQATVVLARWDEHQVEHLILSDSTLLVESPDGAVTPVLDRRLSQLPPSVTALRATARTTGTPEAVRRYVDAVEALRNADGGFYTAAAEPGVAERAVTGSQARASVVSLTALTDGAGRWVEVFGEGDWAACGALVRKVGVRGLIDRVRSLERADPDGVAFRRGKRHDDASGVAVTL